MEIETLCAELEELFELEELMTLSDELLGFAPEDVGGTAKVSSFARALTEYCQKAGAIEALRDAVIAKKPDARTRIGDLSSESLISLDLEAGNRFGPFTIFQHLGKGPVGSVLRVQFEDRDIRLKVLRPSCASVPRGLHRFLTYSRLCRAMTGPGVPKNLSVGNVDGAHYLVQDYFDGQPLDELIAQGGALHLNDAAAILRQLLEGLDQFHKRGLAHGNLKASNVLVKRLDHGQAEVELVDAGVDRLEARVPDNGKIDVLRVAAPQTAAPELWGGEPSGPESDVYAFGVLLYHVLTGKPPVEGETPLDLALAHLTEVPDPPSEAAPEGWVNQALDDYVMRLMNREKGERPQDADAALDAFEHLMMARSQRPPPSDEVIEERIGRLLADPMDAGLALSLEAVAEDGSNAERVAETFMQAFESLGDETGHLQAKLNLAFRAGRLFRQAGNKEEAERVYSLLVELEPTNRVALTALEDLRKQLGKFDELVEAWLTQAEATESSTERAETMAKIGALYESELEDPGQALVAYTQAYCNTPDEADYARSIEHLARADTTAWDEVLAACSEAVSSHAAEDGAKLMLSMGRWYTDKLTRYDLALQCYQAILSNDASNEGAMTGITHIYRRAQQWQELAEALTKQADLAKTPSHARDLRVEAAEIQNTRLNDPDRARHLLENVLEEDPTHKGASEGLGQLYERSGDFGSYVRLLTRRAEALRGSDRLLLLCRIGEIQEERLEQPEDALATYQSVLDEDDAHLQALRGQDRVYTKLGRYSELLKNLQDQVRLAATPRQKLTLLERIAGIYEEEFLDAPQALSTYESMLELDGKHDGALTALARLYNDQKRWQEAADVYERHAEVCDDPGRKTSLLLSRARLLHKQLNAPVPAASAYEAVLELQPDQSEALAAMAQLKASAGDADEALRALEALAEGADNAQVKADSYVKAAGLLEDRGDMLGAIDRYRMALEVQRDHTAAVDGLYEAYMMRSDVSAASQLLMQSIQTAKLDSRRSKLSAELGRLALERLEDLDLAEQAAANALAADHASALGLYVQSEVLSRTDRTEEALACLERLVPHLDELQPDDALAAVFRYMDALKEMGSLEAALAHIETVRRLAPDDMEALLRVADVAFEHGDPGQARNLYTELLDRFEDELSDEDRFQASCRRGEATLRTGEVDMAVMLLEDASDLNPTSPEPLRALAEAYSAREQWERVWDINSRLLDMVDGEERVDALVKLGELASDKLDDKTRALRSFVTALDERPNDRKLLARLMQLYSEEKDWTHLVEVVAKLADFQEDPKQKAKYLMTAGMLSARELGSLDDALGYFAQVMELDPSQENAFEESLAIHRDRADYTAAEKLLKTKMKAASIAKDSATLLETFDALGELYGEIGRVDDAVDAYEAAQTLDAENRERTDKLAHLYSSNTKKYFEKARGLQEYLLRADPYRAEAYKALRRLYTETKNADAAWCLCQALYVLNLAGPDEERFFTRMRSADPAYAQTVLEDEDWGLLAHGDLDEYLTHIFALIEPAVIESRGKGLEDLGYNPYAVIDLQNHQYPVGQTLFYAAGVMNQEAPATFENPNDPAGLQFLPSNPPAISIGSGLMDSSISAQALAFITAHHLCYYRPGFFMRQLVPTGTGLKSWLFAAIKTMSPQFPISPDIEGAVQEAAALLRGALTQDARDELTRVVSKLIQSSASLDLKRWVAAVDLTADRVGFLLSHDLETSMEVIRASEEENSATGQRRLKELVLFAISQPYLKIRARLQIDLQA